MLAAVGLGTRIETVGTNPAAASAAARDGAGRAPRRWVRAVAVAGAALLPLAGVLTSPTRADARMVLDMGGGSTITGTDDGNASGSVNLSATATHNSTTGEYSWYVGPRPTNTPAYPTCNNGYPGMTCQSGAVTAVNLNTSGGSAAEGLFVDSSSGGPSISATASLGGGSDQVFAAGQGTRTFNGGAGTDTFGPYFTQAGDLGSTPQEQWVVDLQAGTAISLGGGGATSSPITITNFENIDVKRYAYDVPHVLRGSDLPNTLTGNDGDDEIDGRQGDDVIRANGGDDTVTGGPGADNISCGEGIDTVTDASPEDTIAADCEILGDSLSVELESTEADDDDWIIVKLTVTNGTDGELTDVVASGLNGLTEMPAELFGPDNTGEIQQLIRDPRPIPETLAPGQVVERNHVFLSTEQGSVLLRGEVNATDSTDDPVRDAHYVEVNIEPEDDPTQRKLEIMGAMEMIATDAHNIVEDSSRQHGNEQAQLMHRKLAKEDRKDWLGGAAGLAVSPIDETIGLLNGLSGEEFATEVPDDDVVGKSGKRKITKAKKQVKQARKQVKQANGNAKAKRAKKNYKQAQKNAAKVLKRETLTPDEARQLYYEEKAKSDTAELWKMYDDMLEGPAKALWKEGGATFRWMLQSSSYEGRQQILADLVYMADLNSEDYGAWNTPGKKYNEGIAAFNAAVTDAEVRRNNTRQQQIDLIANGDPQRAIEIAAESDSYYEGQVLRAFIAIFAPLPGEKYLNKPISFGGKALTKTTSRASANLVNAVAHGDEVAGPIVHGAQDLGQVPNFVDDFTFKTADLDTLIHVDELAKVGGTSVRDQRLAEQLNREVTAELQAEFPDADVEFEMAYRPKKPYEPLDSLAKPQIFGEKTLDPRAVEILGAPEEALGGIAIFLPKHPSKFPGWQELPAVQKASDLELYETHLDAWVNFNKAKPEGKTALWKPALDHTVKADFGGGHSVEVKLEKVKLGKNAYEIKATRLKVDDELIHNGRARTIGGDLDPAVAIDANTGLKLSGEIERRGIEIWNREALRYQREFGFRGGGHGAPIHGDDLSPDGWVKFAHYGAVHLTPAEQLIQEARVVARAGLPVGTKIFPAGLRSNVHLIRTSSSDTWFGPLGDILE